MTQRKDFSTPITNHINNLPVNCWWSGEVLSLAESNSNTSFRDFVLISEFSELEGPLPLAVVANSAYIDLKHYNDKQQQERHADLEDELRKIRLESFDFNAFVLRVVSVDRSTECEQIDEELIEPMTPSSVFSDDDESQQPPPSIFSIPDDTQVYFTDSEHNFFAFTHHLTLFDINARGYVHPVALSYITRDPDKIVIRFEELMERFNEVSIKMKRGNYSNFTLDLKCRLLDLEFTESNVSKQQKPALSIQAIQQAITATKLMIDTLESSTSQMNNMNTPITANTNITNDISIIAADPVKILDSIKVTPSSSPPLPEQHISTTVDPPKDYKPKCIDSLYPVPHFERKLRSLAQLCQEPPEEIEEKDPKILRHNMKRPSLTQKTAAIIPLVFSIIEPHKQQQQNDRPTFANTIKHDMYSEAIKSIQDMTHYLGKSSVVLDVNEEERSFIDPVSSAITFGRTFMLNMNNPKPREDEEVVDEKDDVTKQEEKHDKENTNHHSSSTQEETDDDESYYPVLLAPLRLWKQEDHQPTHLLDILKRYQSLVVDVIFSLMTGRTVLIQGSTSNKAHVKKVVHALSVFVPGQNRNRHQIIDWFETTRLTATQIGSIKLVGIDKENMDPSIHIEGSCVLDIDVKNGSLNSSPVYVEGQWINQLLDRMMLFSSDESYLAYLHTVFMTMSLKAFVYHHLYVCDEFKLLDENASSSAASVVNKGYTSETNSESSTLSRKWSVRLLNYLKKHEDQENEVGLTSSIPPSSASSVVEATTPQPQLQSPQPQQPQPQQPQTPQKQPQQKHAHQDTTTTDEDQDYSEENQATVTLHNLLQRNINTPRTIVGLFGATTSLGEPVTTTTNATASSTTHSTDEHRRDSITPTGCTRRSSSDSMDDSSRNLSEDDDNADYLSRVNRSFLNFGADDLAYFGDQPDESSSSSEEDEKKSRTHRRRKHRTRRKLSDVGPDGVSFIERRGRRYLQEKLKVYGDDQTIVVYLATCVL